MVRRLQPRSKDRAKQSADARQERLRTRLEPTTPDPTLTIVTVPCLHPRCHPAASRPLAASLDPADAGE